MLTIRRARLEMRFWQRKIEQSLDGRSRRFCGINFSRPQQIKGWHCHTTCQPIIKPVGQEDIFNNKIHNINVVIKKINFLQIDPGEIFSFWHLAGRPNESSGFLSASIFINNQVTRDVGGGLCQISTGLYSAALHFGCTVVERYSHSIDAYGDGRYFQLGQDATVTFPHLDLQFMNPFDQPIVMWCETADLEMVVKFYSPKKLCDVIVDSVIEKTIPCPVEKMAPTKGQGTVIQTGSDGKIVSTRRTIQYPDGGTLTQHISTDHYKPMPRIIG